MCLKFRWIIVCEISLQCTFDYGELDFMNPLGNKQLYGDPAWLS